MRGLSSFSLFPPVIKSIIIVNVVIFVLQHLILNLFSLGGVSLSSVFVQYFALMPFDIQEAIFFTNMDGLVFYPWQLISYQFLHGGFFHIFFNLLMLWMFGAELENRWGSGKFLAFYLLSGIGAGIVHLLIGPLFNQAGPTLGASGSVYGILLAFALSNPNRQIYMFPFFIPIKAKYFILILVGFDLFAGLMSSSDGVAHFAHLGGAATAYLLMKMGDNLAIYRFVDKFFNKSKNSYGSNMSTFESNYQEQTKAKVFKVNWSKPAPTDTDKDYISDVTQKSQKTYEIDGESITQRKIDEILDKISESGYQNLSEKEKHILSELSKKI